jgi:type I site-specific restriction endonuclease
MKSEQEIKEYLSTHFFADAIHARGIRAVLRDKFKESAKDFEFKITFDKSVEYKEITDNLITFNDAKKYIWDENREEKKERIAPET